MRIIPPLAILLLFLISFFIKEKMLAVTKREVASIKTPSGCNTLINQFILPSNSNAFYLPYYNLRDIQSSYIGHGYNRYIKKYSLYEFQSQQLGRDLDETWTTENYFSMRGYQDSNLVPKVENREAFTQLKNMLTKLYQSYGEQGAERRNFLETYSREDQLSAYRTTHFMIVSHDEPLMHIQAQHSKGISEPLNLELHFKDQVKGLREKPTNHIVEIGRFTILTSDKVTNPQNQLILKSLEQREDILTEAWLQMLSSFHEGPMPDQLVFQVNRHVLKIAKKLFSPFSIEKLLSVKLSEELPTEYVISLTRLEVEKIRTILFKKKLKSDLKKFLESDGRTLNIEVNKNEKDLFQEESIHKIIVKEKQAILERAFQKSLPPIFKNAELKITTTALPEDFNMVSLDRSEATYLLNLLK